MSSRPNWYDKAVEQKSYLECVTDDIKQAVLAIKEMDRIKKVNPELEDVGGWRDYHKDILMETTIEMLSAVDIQPEDLINHKKED